MNVHRKGKSRFPETQWSLVGRAASSDELTRQNAMTELLDRYVPGFKEYLVKARRIPEDLANDLVHDFVADKVLANSLVRHADKERGKFRNFVLKSLNNFTSTKLRHENAFRDTVRSLDESQALALDENEMADRFDQEWVRQIVRDALQAMEADCAERSRTDMWAIFDMRVVQPMLSDVQPVDYPQIVQQLGIKSPRQAINLLANAKRSFLGHLRASIGKYAKSERQIEAELEDLREIVAR